MALPQLNTTRYVTTIPSLDKEVNFRPYLVKEEKLLMIALESQDQKQIIRAVKDVIKSCVIDDIDIDKLAMFDIEALFLALRSKSVGERVDVRLKCTECEQLTDVNINLDEIGVNKKEVNNVIKLTEDVGVVMRYPAIDDVEGLNQEGGVSAMMSIIYKCVDSLYDSDNVYDKNSYTEKELEEFFDNLNSEQFKKVTEFFENLPTIVHNVHFNCVSCHKSNDVELKGLASFFT